MVDVASNRRRSPRLLASIATASNQEDPITPRTKKATKRTKARPAGNTEIALAKTSSDNESAVAGEKISSTLGRPREKALIKSRPDLKWIMGIDEAGRGPLAGPVVAAAAIVPATINGITDSKKITCEDEREKLYEQIIASPDVTWAVAVVDALRIDEINILQATMEAMSMAASALVIQNEEASIKWTESAQRSASIDRKGCYVSCGGTMLSAISTRKSGAASTKKHGSKKQKIGGSVEGPQLSPHYHALVDGNRIPVDLPCEAESIVKGDSKEYSIAAASILAKVTRDRLMHAYDKLYPDYQLAKHKGYPTKDHMAACAEFGATPIHRRTFAPLKHMLFDDDGKVIGMKEKETPKTRKKKN